MSTKSLIMTVLVAAALLVIAIYMFGGGNAPGGNATSTPSGDVTIREVRAERPNLIVLARGADRVELWYVPTGTGVSESQYAKLGAAKKGGRDGDYDTWTYPIPADVFLATRVFAKAYAGDEAVAEGSLPAAGATQIYENLWGKKATTTPSGPGSTGSGPASSADNTRTLGVGETANYGGLVITFKKVTEDSRCPENAQCVWAGQVQAQVELSANGQSDLKTISSLDQDFEYQDYHLAIVGIEPVHKEENAGRYSLTFKIWK